MIPNLTHGERIVWLGVVEGRKANEIAAEFGVGTTTIQNHLRALKRKLGVTKRGAGKRDGLVELVLVAARWGII